MPKSFPTTSQLITKEIDRLHDSGSGDYQTLIRQVDRAYKPIHYNLAQMLASLAMEVVKWIFLEWGRGTGKTTIQSVYLKGCASQMPRSTGMMIVPDYKTALTRILPSMIQGLEMLGLYKDLHYFIGRRPPKSWNWPSAYQPPERDFERYISFWTGTGIHLISHDKRDDGRGLNADFECGDESALLDPDKLQANTSPALRGSHARAFKNCPLWVSRFHCSTTPLTLKGRWFTKMEESAYEEPGKIRFLRANAKVNLANLSPTYLEDMRKVTIPMIYDAEYLNIRPKVIRGGFYSLLDQDVHGYNNFNYDFYGNEIGKAPDCHVDRVG